jgi:hypothetical protein
MIRGTCWKIESQVMLTATETYRIAVEVGTQGEDHDVNNVSEYERRTLVYPQW